MREQWKNMQVYFTRTHTRWMVTTNIFVKQIENKKCTNYTDYRYKDDCSADFCTLALDLKREEGIKL